MKRANEFKAIDRFKCLFRKEFYSIIPNYLFLLIPAACSMAYLCKTFLDPFISGFLPFWRFPIPTPYNLVIFALILAASGLGLLLTYSYLILEGEGGPCPPFTSKTKRLVKNGPYRVVRHPSIYFKLAGVIGLGMAFESLSFIFIVVPVLLAVSLFMNFEYQEKPLKEKFGMEYEEYKKSTPALIPDFRKLLG
jgi:protein-S-isoprenylcysteine O-methyltransferase Ste14